MLFAVHIGDGILSMPWVVGGFAIAGLLYWLGAQRIRDDEIPRIALLTAVFFIASTIHVPIGTGTSAHMLGNALVGILLGRRAGLAIPVALLLQAVLLGHGGFYPLGANACVQVLPALAASVVFHALHRPPGSPRPWWSSLLVVIAAVVGQLSMIYAAVLLATNVSVFADLPDLTRANQVTFHPATMSLVLGVSLLLAWLEGHMRNPAEFALGLLVGELTVLATATLNCLVLFFGSDDSFAAAPPLILLVAHLPIALVEGILVGITVAFLQRVKPELLLGDASSSERI